MARAVGGAAHRALTARVGEDARMDDRIKATAGVLVYGYPLVYSLKKTGGFAGGGESSRPLSASWNQSGACRSTERPMLPLCTRGLDAHPRRGYTAQ
jgi:hypothetical protein